MGKALLWVSSRRIEAKKPFVNNPYLCDMIWTKAAIDQDSVIFFFFFFAFIMKTVPNADFLIAETPVSQALWSAIMGSNPSEGIIDSSFPVCNVNYPMAMDFIGRLNEATGAGFRLPTADEWELAAKCGDKKYPYQYTGTDDFGALKTDRAPVKKYAPNEIGLYCLTGNVMEWTETAIMIPLDRGAVLAKKLGLPLKEEPQYRKERILKGGSSAHGEYTSHIYDKNHYLDDYRNSLTGLRLAMDRQ